MKIFRKPITYLIVVAMALTVYGVIDVQRFNNVQPQLETVAFNGVLIPYQTVTIEKSVFFGLIPVSKILRQEEPVNLESSLIENVLQVSDTTQFTMTRPDETTVTGQGSHTFIFEQKGTYTFVLDSTPEKGVSVHTEFSVDVDPVPIITLSNTSPAQGELVLVDIANIPSDSAITIVSPLGYSALIQNDHHARFYIPTDYKALIKTYPLTLTINGTVYEKTLEVKAYAFVELHFTVDQDLLDSTVGNPVASKQYKDAMTPLYTSFEPVEYWTEPFIIPVQGAHISSTFGEMRYVNDAKTPSRHQGIDYGVACLTPVVASNAGKIVLAEYLIVTGNTLVIDHGLGLKTYYMHMNSLEVSKDETVTQGQLIGYVGTTGLSTGCHLHFQAMIKTLPINPEFLYTLTN